MGILSYNDKDFLMDGKPFRILSGAIHYFRVVPQYWEDRLKKLKACGFNTVETYTSWNLHERKEGQFDFSGMLDIEQFIKTAEKLGLYVILRPGPYICAEFEFGGLPSWLLTYPSMRLRCNDKLFLEKVSNYYSKLFEYVRPHLSTNGGNVIAVQIENEYGSYGNDKDYLNAIVDIYRQNGIDCLLFTSDGYCHSMITGGSLPEYLETMNFGSNARRSFDALRQHRPNGPLMCMEFWNGWFDHWFEQHHVRDAGETIEAMKEILELGGSINMYMFHGGTNFAFTNGANYDGKYQPTITSYDYNCPLNENGDMTDKYYMVKDLLSHYTDIPADIEVKDLPKKAYGEVKLTEAAGVFDNISALGKAVKSAYTMSMEELGSDFGFVIYSTVVNGPIQKSQIHFGAVHDRALIYINGRLGGIVDRSQQRCDQVEIELGFGESARVDILVENMGRVNYGPKLMDSKGILGGMRLGNRFEFGWDMTAFDLSDLTGLKFENRTESFSQPTFYKGSFEISDKPCDTFLRLDGFEKGIAIINGFNLGRYWNSAGPQKTLYVPAPILKKGTNEIVIFELDRCDKGALAVFCDKPQLG